MKPASTHGASIEFGLGPTFDRVLRAALSLGARRTIASAGVLFACSACSTHEAAKPDVGASAIATTPTADPDTGMGDACAPVATRLYTVHHDGSADLFNFERYGCGVPSHIEPQDGSCSFNVSRCQELCSEYGACACHALDGGCGTGNLERNQSTVIKCDLDCFGNVGRRPRGLAANRGRKKAGALGDYFARAAHLEAASVPAFEELEAALVALGAPPSLVAAARAAASDERRHARVTRQLAHRFGGTPARVRRSREPRAGLNDLAIDNAVEGCVRETYGALIASFQAARAEDLAISEAMRRIADDETRHAELAWAVARWVEARLGKEAHARVNAAFRRSVDELESDVSEPPEVLSRVAGLPNCIEQRALLAGLRRDLWDPAQLFKAETPV